jgi:hypothetical protein
MLREGVYADTVRCVSSLRVFILCDLINLLKSNLEMSFKLKESIEELFKQKVWLRGVHVCVRVRIKGTTIALGVCEYDCFSSE